MLPLACKVTVLCAFLLAAPLVYAGSSEGLAYNNIVTVNRAFQPGERLQYSISWSGIIEAGVAVMEINAVKTPDGKNAIQFLSTANSKGIVSAFYPVHDTVASIVDAANLCSISYALDQSHGKRKKRRILSFDQEKQSVKTMTDGMTETVNIPYRTQDALSSLYYLRTRDDLQTGKSLHIDVFDGGKTWSVEVRPQGKERIKTGLGEFDTIKVTTYPKYEGVFMHKGEIMIWLTDDARKLPVLMKSRISIGSIMATLTAIQGGEAKQ